MIGVSTSVTFRRQPSNPHPSRHASPSERMAGGSLDCHKSLKQPYRHGFNVVILFSATFWPSSIYGSIGSLCCALPPEWIIVIDTEKALQAGRVVRLVLRILNIFESVKVLQLLGPDVFISMKGFVLIAMVLKALEYRMILRRVAMEMDSPVR